MSYYFEPYIFVLLGCLVALNRPFDAAAIIFLSVALILVSLQILCRKKTFALLLGLAGVLIALFFPGYFFFLPATAYLPNYRKTCWFPIAVLLALLVRFDNFSRLSFWSVMVLYCLSLYMSFEAARKDHLARQVKVLFDNATEQQLALRRQNEKLLQSQNDEIYIATLQERNRIAREIHDNVGHMLSSSILQVGALLAICRDENLKPILASLKTTLDNAMNSIRNSVHDLHDESVDLKQALTHICEEFTFCALEFNCDVGKNVPKEIKYSFISIVKEALNNVIKHSNATKVTITLREHPGLYQLLIQDNGTTTKPSPDTSPGIGLTNMKDRIDALRGNLHISSEHGFRIFISIPKQNERKEKI